VDYAGLPVASNRGTCIEELLVSKPLDGDLLSLKDLKTPAILRGLASDGTSYPLHCTWNVAISRFSVGGPSRMIFPVTLNRWAVLDLIAV